MMNLSYSMLVPANQDIGLVDLSMIIFISMIKFISISCGTNLLVDIRIVGTVDDVIVRVQVDMRCLWHPNVYDIYHACERASGDQPFHQTLRKTAALLNNEYGSPGTRKSAHAGGRPARRRCSKTWQLPRGGARQSDTHDLAKSELRG